MPLRRTSPARVRAGRLKHLICCVADLRHSAHRSECTPRRCKGSAEQADWRRQTTPESGQRAPSSRRGGLGSHPLCTHLVSTAWRARRRASRAPIHSELQGHLYGGCIAPHESCVMSTATGIWGTAPASARRRKVDYVTRRLGDRERYPRGGSPVVWVTPPGAARPER